MPRRRIKFKNQKQRPVLSDTLPYEVPASFSNRFYFDFLVKYEVEYTADKLQWVHSDDGIDPVIRLLFGIREGVAVTATPTFQWGKPKVVRHVPRVDCASNTIPFVFRISHKENEARNLTVCHPRNQLQVADFYYRFCDLIVYYAGLSPFSIRKPVSVARFTYFKDRTHYQNLSNEKKLIEESGREYEQVGSYFSYHLYSNVHKFFESYPYHKAEKKFEKLMRVDISKCFDSIYTHSIAWALLGKQVSKDALPQLGPSFYGKFDQLMRDLNHGETNGIVIGPEFSRIFAELILQSVDRRLENALQERFNLRNKVHYEIHRYVDDYFIFVRTEADRLNILDALSALLSEVKLHINAAKTVTYEKPLITEMTVAKDRISTLLSEEVRADLELVDPGEDLIKFKFDLNSTSLIVKFKTIIKAEGVNYRDILNYTFSVLERRIDDVVSDFFAADPAHRSDKRLVKALLGAVEFLFFTYASSPKVNHTIKVCRIVSQIVRLFEAYPMGFELKHFAFKFIFDNIVQQIERSAISPYSEVETLYLLIALKQLGREYWLEERELARYFGVLKDPQGSSSDFVASPKLGYFTITVGLLYMQNKKRYASLRALFEEVAVSRISARKAYCKSDAEIMMLALDIWKCPYVSQDTKGKIRDVYGISDPDLTVVQKVTENWFTAWDKFSFQDELDAKRSREVY